MVSVVCRVIEKIEVRMSGVVELPEWMTEFRVERLPEELENDVFLIPDMNNIHDDTSSVIDTELLLHKITESTSEKAWKVLRKRKVLSFGGLPDPGGMIPTTLPPYLARLLGHSRIASLFPQDLPPNHALINSYAPGDGIAHHQDGPLYTPLVAILSLGSPLVMVFSSKPSPIGGNGGKNSVLARVFLPPRSLLVFRGNAYERVLHGIEGVERDVLWEDGVANWPDVVEWAEANPEGVIVLGGGGGSGEGDEDEDEDEEGDEDEDEDEEGDGDEEEEEEEGMQIWVRRGVRVSVTIRNVPKVMKGIRIQL